MLNKTQNKTRNKSISYNRKLKLWQLHSKTDGTKEFVKTKEQATKWLTGEIGNGNCYEMSAKFLLNTKETQKVSNPQLCHGIVCGQGPLEGAIFGHSWIEYERMPTTTTATITAMPTIKLVLDKSNGKTLEIPSPIYYHLGRIEPNKVKKYSQEEVRENILKYQHWGPW